MKKERSSNLGMGTVTIFVILVTLSASASAKNLYVATTGSDSVTYANNSISTPWASWSKAFSSALAGDTVYFRGGTYTISSTIETNGRNGTSSSPITFSNYPGEQVIVNSTADPVIFMDSQYNQVIADSVGNISISTTGTDVFWIGENGDGSYCTIEKCKLQVASAGDNTGCIVLQANRSNYAYISNNILVGHDAGNNNNNVIQYLGGGNIGTKILYNDISGSYHGINIKHANGDSSSATGAEIAYNYIHNNSDGDIYAQPTYINIHDNLLIDGAIVGDNGGGAQGHNNTWNHNTFIGSYSNYGGAQINTNDTITNNIMTSITTESGDTGGYNMYTNHAAIWTGDLGNTSPTYKGGSDPIAKYALTSGSAGHAAGSDGKDMGADISNVGSGASSRQLIRHPLQLLQVSLFK